MGFYIQENDVKILLQGKVQFTDDPLETKAMQNALLRKIVQRAEVQVETDLSVRYQVPLVEESTGKFEKLSDRTKLVLQQMFEYQAVMFIIKTYFGRGSSIGGEEYYKMQKESYESLLTQLVGKREEKKNISAWKYPPLTGLKLNYMNQTADDGFVGAVLHSTRGDGAFPATRINDPSENFFNGKLDSDG